MEKDIYSLIKQLWSYIGKRRQLQFFGILVLTILSAFAEVLSLGSLLPFLGVLVSPTKVFESPAVFKFASYFHLTTPESVIFPLTMFFIIAVVIATVLRVVHLWATIKVTFGCGIDLSSKLYFSILHKPYSDHLSLNSSSVISTVNKVDVAVNVLSQIVRLVSSSILMLSIVIAIFLINPVVALVTFFCFGGCYGLISYSFKSRVRSNGQIISVNKTYVIKSLQVGMGAIRDVILDGTQQLFVSLYRRADSNLKNAEASNSFIEGSPRFIMESLGIILIAVLAYLLSFYMGGVGNSIPLLGAMALGAQRLLPALQQGYNAITSINGHYASLHEVVSLLQGAEKLDNALCLNSTPIVFESNIELKNIYFRYSDQSDWVLKGVNLKVKKGQKIGIVGYTGGGKSTLMDILMGLLKPTKGELIVDGIALDQDKILGWHKNISHVPQMIFLTDGSIAENIALGLKEYDLLKIKDAAKKASIAEFIDSIPTDYDTLVGERGIALSGGQRQRIAIARALYKDNPILVFDEATSALDNQTEGEVMNAIDALDDQKTVFLIAHRLTTVQNCDFIIVLKDGKIIDSGTYSQLLKNSDYFN
jgi:ATP-binding cassette subfamily B protein